MVILCGFMAVSLGKRIPFLVWPQSDDSSAFGSILIRDPHVWKLRDSKSIWTRNEDKHLQTKSWEKFDALSEGYKFFREKDMSTRM